MKHNDIIRRSQVRGLRDACISEVSMLANIKARMTMEFSTIRIPINDDGSLGDTQYILPEKIQCLVDVIDLRINLVHDSYKSKIDELNQRVICTGQNGEVERPL